MPVSKAREEGNAGDAKERELPNIRRQRRRAHKKEESRATAGVSHLCNETDNGVTPKAGNTGKKWVWE